MQMPRHSSYATDDSTYIVNFLRKDVGGTVADDQLDEDQFVRFIDVDESELSLSMSEGNALFYMAGWIAFKLRQQLRGCSICVSAIIGEISPQVDNRYAQLTMIKTYGNLIVPSAALFQLICNAEQNFRSRKAMLNLSRNVLKCLIGNIDSLLVASELPACHCLGHKALVKFYNLRAAIWAKHLTSQTTTVIQHGSKTAKACTSIQ